MKITTLDTGLDYIEFLLLQPSVVRSLSEQANYGAVVPDNCKAVVACHVFRAAFQADDPNDPEVIHQDIYARGFAYCVGEDQFCIVKGMKIALEEVAKQFRAIKAESPWTKVIESRLKDAFIGEQLAVIKANDDVKRRLNFDPYRIDPVRPKDWQKRPKVSHLQVL